MGFRLPFAAVLLAAAVIPSRAATIGADQPASFSLCEAAVSGTGAPRDECQAADIRFQGATGSQFGFAVAMGRLNGDDLDDLAVGDPANNRVYIFYGRPSAKDSYDLDPTDLADRAVSPETKADVILTRDAPFPGQVGSFGFSLKIGQPIAVTTGCLPGNTAAALVIGSPGEPGTTGNAPGTIFHIRAGGLCRTVSNPPVPALVDPESIGQPLQSPDAAPDDEFGYSVAFGRLLLGSRPEEDVIVGARNALDGAGRVSAFPVTAGVVSRASGAVLRIEGKAGDGLGEVLAVGDLDQDFDATLRPLGKRDDLAVGAVGAEQGKVLLVQGPASPTGGRDGDGIYREGVDPQIKAILGEQAGDFFGFSVDVSSKGKLAVGAIFADNTPPSAAGTGGGDPRTNVASGPRINAGKAYVWNADLFDALPAETGGTSANTVLVARRSGDQLGFAVAFGDVDKSQTDDLIVTARREDGSALTVDEIDRGAAYVVFDTTVLVSPVDLNRCAVNANCTGVGGVDVMVFGGDRGGDAGDEIGYALATGDFNGDKFADVLVSSLTQARVYAVTLDDHDNDRLTTGRNIRDDDDDNDTTTDAGDCAPLNAAIFGAATEVACNEVDENCNGMTDDAPDHDGDTFDACAPADVGDLDGKAKDCDDNDSTSFPGAAEVCDGNNNACGSAVPAIERDLDGDHYARCSPWVDTQNDNPTILGGGDCADSDAAAFPGAAPLEATPNQCMRDSDGDDYGDVSPPAGITAGTDCDDRSATAAATFPGAAQLQSPVTCMKDVDNDGYGDTAVVLPVVSGSDCRDTDAASYPGALELCDGDDNACAGFAPNNEQDLDGDRFVLCTVWADTQGNNAAILGGGDCDETEATTFPGSAEREPFATACMKDKDGDGFGDLTPPAGVVPGTDCDDTSQVAASTFPGAAQIEGPLNCMKDVDNDGYGDATVVLPVVRGSDCDDAALARNPGAPEIVGDGIDQDCSGSDRVSCFVDLDLDGFGGTTPVLDDDGICTDQGQSATGNDCNDANVAIFPGAIEIPGDTIDQDCNGHDTITCFLDADRDGFGNLLGTTVLADDGVCNPAQQEAPSAGDCNDADPNTRPGATERCDGNDNLCDGSLPANELDLDGDGYVPCAGFADTQGDNPTLLGGGDCDPADPDTHPSAASRETVPGACRRDKDHDDFGDIAPPAGVTAGTDCDDTSITAAATFPGVAQNDGPLNCMRDVDDDGYGDASAALPIVRGTDCNDRDGSTHPTATERCDGNDNACAGSIPATERDLDLDGYVVCSGFADTQADNPLIVGGGDCDESDADTFPGSASSEPFAGACMRDKDGDAFGDQSPPFGVTAGTDCDDDSAAAASTFPGAAEIEAPFNCMKDADDDGYGDIASVLPVVRGTDCDDADPARHPGAPETPGDGVDQDCDGADLANCFVDADQDGFGGTTPQVPVDGDCTDPGESANSLDCDDGNPARFPFAPETPGDGVDQDCNGVDAIACVLDADRDGHGTTVGTIQVALDGTCDAAQQESSLADDCDDSNATRYPGATEVVGDGIDQDCNGSDAVSCFVDGDLDGFGSAVTVVAADGNCTTPGESSVSTDCNDADPTIYPGAAEIPLDGIDQDCNGSDLTTCFVDGDLDGFGGSTTIPPTAGSCAVAGKSPFNTDCNDADVNLFPGAPETPDDAIDQDCNGADTITCIVDGDQDGFGTSLGATTLAADGQCDTAQGEATSSNDCDDASALVFPGAPEVPDDAIDQDCNGADTVACFVDADLDGFGGSLTVLSTDGDCVDPGESAVGTDCADADVTRFPGATEVPGDGIDQDCNGSDTIACIRDADQDGFGTTAGTIVLAPDGQCDTAQQESTTSNDCNDGDAAIHPGATEIPNDGIDQDCSGADLVTCFVDADLDGFGGTTPVASGNPGCSGPGESPLNTDCNDASASVFPGATEVPDDGIDQNCSGSDTITCIVDADQDGYGTSLGTTTLAADGVCNRTQQESATSNDCNDSNAAIHPGAAEIPNDGIDQDCNGTDLLNCFVDADHDGFGTTTTAPPVGGACTAVGVSPFNTDCDDTTAAIYPGAVEIPGDTIDQDCSGTDTLACVVDADSDGSGTILGTVVFASDGTCDTAQQEAPTAVDCDDADANTHPGATERCDGNDNVCDGSVPASELDGDGDGYVPCAGFTDTQGDNPAVLGGGDCDAADVDTYPGAAPLEVFSQGCMRDKDGDGFGDIAPPAGVVPGTDCDDRTVAAPVTFPGAAQIEGPLNCMKDADDDGYGDASAALPVVPGTDCSDSNSARHPGATEVCGDAVDSNCDGADPICPSSRIDMGRGPATPRRPKSMQPARGRR